MSDDRYRFMLGDFECLAVLDTHFDGDASLMFSNVSPEASHPILKARNINPQNIRMASTCLAVHTGSDDWVLLDTGVGAGPNGGRLLAILQDEGIQPAHIIITHAHGDHYGGLLDDAGKPSFPNAQVYMCRDEWAVFTSPDYSDENPERAAAIQQNLVPAENQIERVECGGEILPGFSVIPLPGHTPHHIGILVESNGEELIFAADAVGHPLHLEHPDWHFGFDSEPETARQSRVHLAELAAESGALVLMYHFEFPGLGHIVADGDAWKWEMLQS